MRTFLLIITTALLTAVGLLYARQSDAFPRFFELVIPQQSSEKEPLDPTSKIVDLKGDSCITPRNETIPHGEVFLSFMAPQASLAEGGCISKSTLCNNGTRSVDEDPYEFATCALETPRTCEVNQFVFPHGTTYTFYKPTTAGTCVSQERTCTDGEVDGDEGYIYISCPSSCPPFAEEEEEEANDASTPVLLEQKTTISKTGAVSALSPKIQPLSSPTTLNSLAQPNCPSPTGGYRREPGQEGSVYPSATAAYDTTCQKVNVVCMYGSIRYGTKENPGNIVTTDMSASCTVAEPADCASPCGEVMHGSSITTYSQNILPHGNGQTCDDVRIFSTCSDGVLSPTPGDACSCQIAPPAACEAPNGVKIDHGLSLTLYKDKQVEASLGDGSDVCFRQRRQCVNGVRHDQSGNPSNFTYKHESCTVLPPSSSAAVKTDTSTSTETGDEVTAG